MQTTENISDRKNVVSGKFRRNLFLRLVGKVKTWNQRRLAIRELRAMPDHLLRDLGIERYQIADAVNSCGDFAELLPCVTESAVAPLKKAAA